MVRFSENHWYISRGIRPVRGKLVRASLADPDCDILCVTEGCAKILPDGGHVIDGGPDRSCPIKNGQEDRRKVLLWSKRPWSDDFCVYRNRPLGGRFVAGTTETEAGPLDVRGVCIPWPNAHVTGCQRDRKRWEEHLRWLKEFETLSNQRATLRTVVLGDFNQRIPRRRQDKQVYAALRRAFVGFNIATAGWLGTAKGEAIDHIAHTPDLLQMGDIGIWPRQSEHGRHLSDHFGVWCDFDDFGPSSTFAASQ